MSRSRRRRWQAATLAAAADSVVKEEVRNVGLELGLPEAIVWRQPFPGPGLCIRMVGEVTQERLDVLREAGSRTPTSSSSTRPRNSRYPSCAAWARSARAWASSAR